MYFCMLSVIVTVILSILTVVPLIMFVVGKFCFTFLITFRFIDIIKVLFTLRYAKIMLIRCANT